MKVDGEKGPSPKKPLLETVFLKTILRGIEAYLWTCRPLFHHHPDSHDMIKAARPVIAALWHSSLIYTLYHFRNNRAAVMVSASSDGEWVARALRIWGQLPVRGSRLKGGVAAIKKMGRIVKEKGVSAGIVADGANGPACKVQNGALILARDTGLPIVPTGFAARPAHYFNSWDRMILPLPFSRIAMVYGPPLFVASDARGRRLEEYRNLLETRLNQATSRARKLVGSQESL